MVAGAGCGLVLGGGGALGDLQAVLPRTCARGALTWGCESLIMRTSALISQPHMLLEAHWSCHQRERGGWRDSGIPVGAHRHMSREPRWRVQRLSR